MPTDNPLADPARRQQVHKLLEGISVFPWRVARAGDDEGAWWGPAPLDALVFGGPDSSLPVAATNDDGIATVEEVSNAAFIAQAPQLLWDALRYIETLEQERDKALWRVSVHAKNALQSEDERDEAKKRAEHAEALVREAFEEGMAATREICSDAYGVYGDAVNAAAISSAWQASAVKRRLEGETA